MVRVDCGAQGDGILSEHDPLPRKLDDEPHFALVARDPTAADLVRLWLAIRKRDEHLMDQIVKRLKRTMEKLPYQPSKDGKHILSAQDVANRMDMFLMERTHGNVKDAT